MNDIKQWFLDQSPRDQLMLAVGGVLVMLYILLFMVLLPLREELQATQKRNLAALQEQQRVHNLAGRVLGQQSSGGGASGQNLNALLNDTLREFGLRMENFQPSGDAARVRLGTSDFNKVFAWLTEMEVKQGVQIRDLTITADQNPGAVLVNLQLVQGE